MPTPTIVMTIAGSDSGGAAGIQADLKTLSAHGVYATTVVTAVTAQNTTGVQSAVMIETADVARQLAAVLSDLAPAATKTGLLRTAATVSLIAGEARRLGHLVVDPVLANRSGEVIVDSDAIEAYRSELIPAATLATPNHREASLLVDEPIRDVADQRRAAERLATLTGTPILVTGGRLGAHQPIDVLSDGHTTHELAGRWVNSRNVHGTGDALSSSIAARLASGSGLLAAASEAKAWVARAIAGATDWQLGSGEGPIDHFGWA
jgi:hydroxymethylpyrimidine kinase/phosphomethylpyrimidine kinase